MPPDPPETAAIASKPRTQCVPSELGIDASSYNAPSLAPTPKIKYEKALSGIVAPPTFSDPVGCKNADAGRPEAPPHALPLTDSPVLMPLSPTPSPDSSISHRPFAQTAPSPQHPHHFAPPLPPPSPQRQQQRQQQHRQFYASQHHRRPFATQTDALATAATASWEGGPSLGSREHRFPTAPEPPLRQLPHEGGYSPAPTTHRNLPKGHSYPTAASSPTEETKLVLPVLLPAITPATANAAEGSTTDATPKRAPMRSNIACKRCRRSKIKCENNGNPAVPCETCIKAGRDCQFPSVNTPISKRPAEPQPLESLASSAGPGGLKHDSGVPERGPERKRLKRLDTAFRLESMSSGAVYAQEVLSATYLTEVMWIQICDIFRLHFASELPFLHMPTLKENMGPSFKNGQRLRSADTNLVVLGVLTLTSRFHSDLVKYVSHAIANQNNAKGRSVTVKADPWASSDYYAEVLTRALGPLSTSMATASVERVQAFLMLGLYEWSQTKRKNGGLGAWMYVGVAIRMAQALGLCFDGGQGGRRHRKAVPASTVEARAGPGSMERRPCRTGYGSDAAPKPEQAKAAAPSKETVVNNEIRRRTMFSCLILDRMLSCGDERLPAIRSEDLQIRLPCSDFSFDSAQEIDTDYLKRPSVDRPVSSERAGSEISDSVLARFIQLVDIWGEISKYSFAGGRVAEKCPPWEESEFRRLRNLLDAFYGALPSMFTFSRSNYYIFESHQNSSTYVSLHMLGAVCRIMLHREYIPFIPIRCKGPEGPLDEPTFPKGSAPPGFWEESAEQVFKAARDIVDLIEICQGCDKLPMSALVVFSIWTAAFVGIYAWHFPLLDVQRHMLDDLDSSHDISQVRGAGNRTALHVQSYGPTGTTFVALNKMATWLQMACTHVSHFQDMDRFYEGVKEDYRKHVANRRDGKNAGRLSIRMGGGGGGLDEWKVHGPKVTNNGSILSGVEALGVASDRAQTDGVAGAASTVQTSVHGGDSLKGSHHKPAAEEGTAASVLKTRMAGCNDKAYMGQGLPGGNVSMPVPELAMPDEASLEQPLGSLQAWDPYSQQPDGQMQLQLNAEQQLPELSPGYQLEEQPGFIDMRNFYEFPDVLPYINSHQGMRWQDASHAAGIEHFCHGDSLDGHAVWTDQYGLYEADMPYMG